MIEGYFDVLKRNGKDEDWDGVLRKLGFVNVMDDTDDAMDPLEFAKAVHAA